MKKVGFTRSIHLKFVLIYMLLILIAMQIIGVYFVGKLEQEFVENFEESVRQRVNLLEYYLREELVKDRSDSEAVPLEQDITKILDDFVASDIKEVRVINSDFRIIGTSDPNRRDKVGQSSPEAIVKRSMVFNEDFEEVVIDPETGDRLWIRASPITTLGEVEGVILVMGNLETVFSQLKDINKIFFNGTAIALLITALLGILLAQTITRPISDMRKQALAMAKGNFSRKVRVYGYDEIGQLAITFNNLTKRLQEAQAMTEGERRKLSSVLAYMTDGVIATDRKGRIILINEPAAKLLNVSRETVMSQPLVDLLEIQDTYTFENIMEQNDSLILDYSTQNQPYMLRANFSVIQKETGFVNGVIAVLHDVTEQEKIDIERREFVANVSHELRTPLTTMRSYLEALAEGAWQDDEIAPRFLEVTQEETERMIRLVNDLLQLSKMDSKDYRMNTDWINFTSLFNRVIDRFDLSKSQNVSFKRLLIEEAVFVEIDQDKITQVLDNIISNALKYSPEGGQVTFTTSYKDEFLLISVKDEGMGIPRDKVEKIFERFYRVDKARTRQLGGTGLGLAIAREMVEAHGGRIWAESEEGKGTTIYFTLPYDPAQEDEWT
ncbi:cell wall metabolism sensor histidine kinase WalK [Mangrovibacillus cuniculi]|uniref:histidine kinase n=1 Tax=Mangrovibacillus cuniculi TaxID=2593652 RepID=A0A7S8CDC5_9BACI|nr:cell wall metabolism sensor histidine kinase WalK [Mangrovibacillus cuniculi]QPC47904.1 cell wall metabolism sensor histidine kinase WalK [Mangrovibacillus cuniculi]